MAATPSRRPSSWWPVLVCDAGMMCLAFAVNLAPVFLTTIQTDLGGLSHEQLGRVGAFTFVGLVIGILATGPLADRFGAKRFAVAGHGLIATGLLLLGTCPGYRWLLAAVTLMGLGAGTLDMVLSPIVCALQPERRTAALNWLHSFYCVGAVVAVLAGVWALRTGVAWRTLTLALVPLPLVVGVVFAGLRVPPLGPDAAGAAAGAAAPGWHPAFRVCLAAIFLGGATELGLAQWLPAYAEQTLGYGRATGGLALTGFSLAMALGRMVVGSAAGRVSGPTLILWGCWSSVGLFLLSSFAPWPAVALAASVAVGFTGSALWPSMLALAADRFPGGGATMFGLLAAAGNAGGVVMPWVVGAVGDLSSLRWGLATATLCPLGMALLVRSLRPPARTRPPAPVAAGVAPVPTDLG